MTRLATRSCHAGIWSASRKRLMVVAKVEKESENLMGLIQGLMPWNAAGSRRAKEAKTGTTAIRAQPRRESTASFLSSWRKKPRTADGESVCTSARRNAEIHGVAVCAGAGSVAGCVHSSCRVAACWLKVVPLRYVMTKAVLFCQIAIHPGAAWTHFSCCVARAFCGDKRHVQPGHTTASCDCR